MKRLACGHPDAPENRPLLVNRTTGKCLTCLVERNAQRQQRRLEASRRQQTRKLSYREQSFLHWRLINPDESIEKTAARVGLPVKRARELLEGAA